LGVLFELNNNRPVFEYLTESNGIDYWRAFVSVYVSFFFAPYINN